MHGQQNLKNLDAVTKFQWSLIFNNRAETRGCVMLHHVGEISIHLTFLMICKVLKSKTTVQCINCFRLDGPCLRIAKFKMFISLCIPPTLPPPLQNWTYTSGVMYTFSLLY
jgi:hypothetical protein